MWLSKNGRLTETVGIRVAWSEEEVDQGHWLPGLPITDVRHLETTVNSQMYAMICLLVTSCSNWSLF